ncbi:MAG: hypothetical protein H6819_12310 [Phycisphaerales bacterium]|nr:hypothetical protein [Phycisphaerales bacterium]MCB9857516.1 hypothetical protein [Phycisphaerales bacterium]MCB9864499.1 hypothetical protein [Phycisphaerales bacterium]
MNHRTCIWALILALIFSQYASAASIDVFDMNMTTSVYVDSQQVSQYVLGPTNPLVTTRHAQLGLTKATTVIALAWSPAGGSFSFLFDHVIDDSPGFSMSKTFGGVGITSDVDLMLDYHYTYSFSDLTGGIILTSINTITRLTDDGFETIMRTVRQGGTGSLDPRAGTFNTTRHMLLEAGERYGISYSIELHAGFEAGAIGTGNGALDFTLTPIPEPATAMLVALMSIAVIRHRPSSRPLLAPRA